MPFTATVLKYDPYRKFKFLIKWDGVYVAGVSKVSGVTRTVESTEWRAGGDNHTSMKLPGTTKYDPITLERGLSGNPAFMAWMDLVNAYQMAGGTSVEHVHKFRKDIIIEVYNLASEKVMTVQVFKAWPSKISLGDLDAKSAEVIIETLELQHEGWQLADWVATPDER